MDKLYFSEEHLMLRDMVRDLQLMKFDLLVKTLIKSQYSKRKYKKMAELGLMGIPWDTNILEGWTLED